MEREANFEVVNVSKINMERLIEKYRKKRATELIKMICENNKKLLKIKIELMKLEVQQKQKKELERRRAETRESRRREEEERQEEEKR